MLKCKELRQQIYEDFYQSRLVQKSVKLLDNIPKTRKTTKSKKEIIKHDFNKEVVMADLENAVTKAVKNVVVFCN